MEYHWHFGTDYKLGISAFSGITETLKLSCLIRGDKWYFTNCTVLIIKRNQSISLFLFFIWTKILRIGPNYDYSPQPIFLHRAIMKVDMHKHTLNLRPYPPTHRAPLWNPHRVAIEASARGAFWHTAVTKNKHFLYWEGVILGANTQSLFYPLPKWRNFITHTPWHYKHRFAH